MSPGSGFLKTTGPPPVAGAFDGASRLSHRRSLPLAVIGALAVHAAMLAWSATRHSPTWDEVGHLPAGISHWTFGRFDLYRVNPPLVRMVAAVPAILAGTTVDWTEYPPDAKGRPEFGVGACLIRDEGLRSLWLFTLARWACIPFSVVVRWFVSFGCGICSASYRASWQWAFGASRRRFSATANRTRAASPTR